LLKICKHSLYIAIKIIYSEKENFLTGGSHSTDWNDRSTEIVSFRFEVKAGLRIIVVAHIEDKFNLDFLNLKNM
jgi:hypothetical protein